MPDEIRDPPRLWPDAKTGLEAWVSIGGQLDPGRTAPLPITEIAAWMDVQGIQDPDERAELYELVRAADGAWLGEKRRPRGGAG